MSKLIDATCNDCYFRRAGLCALPGETICPRASRISSTWRSMRGAISGHSSWVAIITVLFMLPQLSPVTVASFNYAVVAVVVVLGFAGIWWLVSARTWFTGPKVQGTAEELAAIERDLAGTDA